MSFGYSFGDFVAGANLSYRLICVLTESRGASLEYQEAISELGAIQQTFLEVGRMKASSILSQATINAASCIVLSSIDLIGDFLERTKSYRKQLYGNGRGASLSGSWQKMGWVMFKVEELRALKNALHLKLANINVLLSAARFHGSTDPTDMESPIAQFRVVSPDWRLNKGPMNSAKEEKEASQHEITQLADITGSTLSNIPDSATVTPGKKSQPIVEPIKFKDVVGRKFTFPFDLCNTWASMENLIRMAFLHMEVIEPHVAEGHYDLVGPNGEIILPALWEKIIEPGWAITMHMWPLPELEKRPSIRMPLSYTDTNDSPGDTTFSTISDEVSSPKSTEMSKVVTLKRVVEPLGSQSDSKSVWLGNL